MKIVDLAQAIIDRCDEGGMPPSDLIKLSAMDDYEIARWHFTPLTPPCGSLLNEFSDFEVDRLVRECDTLDEAWDTIVGIRCIDPLSDDERDSMHRIIKDAIVEATIGVVRGRMLHLAATQDSYQDSLSTVLDTVVQEIVDCSNHFLTETRG